MSSRLGALLCAGCAVPPRSTRTHFRVVDEIRAQGYTLVTLETVLPATPWAWRS